MKNRYIKYINILRKGFLNDVINSADILSHVTRNDLWSQPFNIQGLTDRLINVSVGFVNYNSTNLKIIQVQSRSTCNY